MVTVAGGSPRCYAPVLVRGSAPRRRKAGPPWPGTTPTEVTMTDRPLTDLERQTRDFERQAREMMAAHRPTLIGGMDALDFSDLAAFLDWPIESSVAFLVGAWDEHDE